MVGDNHEDSDDHDRSTTPRQSAVHLSRTSSTSTGSSMSRSSSSVSKSSRNSRSTLSSSSDASSRRTSGSYSDSLSRSGSSRDSRYSADNRSSTGSVVQDQIREVEDMIYKFKEQLDFHKRRADDEERRADEAIKKAQDLAESLKKVNEARLVAQQEATRANEELRLYKIQLEYAQREINRAQAVLEAVDRQRYEAEKQAADARARARRLNEELLIEDARRQGRRQGINEGMQRGRTLHGPDLTRSMAGNRSSYVDGASFMESVSAASDDGRTVSSASIRSSRTSIRTESRPQSFAETVQPPSTPSPPPVLIHEPRTASEILHQTPIARERELSPPPPMPSPPRPRSRAPSVTRSEHSPTPAPVPPAPSPRPRSRAPSVAPSEKPPVLASPQPRSRAPSVVQSERRPSPAPVPASPRPQSRAPSVIQSEYSPAPAPRVTVSPQPTSRAPSVVYSEYPPTPARGVAVSPQPPSRAPSIAHSEYRAPSFRAPSPGPSPVPQPAPVHPPPLPDNFMIPPDNFIPVIGLDGQIRLPPPHEFYRLAVAADRNSPNPYAQAEFDSFNNPSRQTSVDNALNTHGQMTPALSVIEEVNSMNPSPVPGGFDGQDIRPSSAMSMRSRREYPDDAASVRTFRDRSPARSHAPSTRAGSPTRSVATSYRARSPAPSAAPSMRSIRPSETPARSAVDLGRSERGPGSVAGSVNPRRPSSALSRVSKGDSSNPPSIEIQIQPPSISDAGGDSHSRRSRLSPLPPGTSPLPAVPLPDSADSNVGSGVMPGGMNNSGYSYPHDDVASHVSRSSRRRPKDDDAVSSNLSGDFSLTTPPSKSQILSPPPKSTVSAATGVSSKSRRTARSSRG